jgi:predicted AlkP superfamily pyrophosphatase or phosphodiesterase
MRLALLTALLAAAPLAAADKEKKVLFIGIDGCRYDAIQYSQAKHLKELAAGGAVSERCDVLGDRKTGADTSTGPGWSAALTGTWADKHRVLDNTFKNHNLSDYPTFLARYKAARPAARVAAFVTWAQFRDHVFDRSAWCEFVLDGDKMGYEVGDKCVAHAAAKGLANTDLDAAFVYFGNTDSAGHGYGFHPKAPKYTNSIEAVDEYVGLVLKAVRGRKTYAHEDWLVIVCTDHGGKGRGHSLGEKEPEIRTGFLILNGPSVVAGAIKEQTHNVDVAVTALAHLGVVVKPEWRLDGRAVGLKK